MDRRRAGVRGNTGKHHCVDLVWSRESNIVSSAAVKAEDIDPKEDGELLEAGSAKSSEVLQQP